MSFLSWLIRRWWFWVAAPIVVFGFAVLSLRLIGQAEWQHEQAAARAAGEPLGFADVVALAPPDDDVRQQRLWEWGRQVKSELWITGFNARDDALPELWTGRQQDREPWLSAEQRAAVAAGRSTADAELAELRATGPVAWGVAGWLHRDFPGPGPVTAERAWYTVRRLHPGSVQLALDLSTTPAVPSASGNQLTALLPLDELLRDSSVCLCAMDARRHARVELRRDNVYLAWAVTGRLPPDRLRAWLAEPATSAVACAQGIRCDRARLFTPLAEHGYDPETFFRTAWNDSDHLAIVLNDAVFLPSRLARASRYYRALAGCLLGGPPPVESDLWAIRPTMHSVLTHGDLGSFRKYAADAIQDTNRHRLVRAAALITLAWRGGALPADPAAAVALCGAHLHADAQILPPAVYERLSPTRFRLGLAPGGPVPALEGAVDLGNGTAIGTPAAASAVDERPWSLEFDCAALPPASGGARAADAPTP